MEPLFHFNALAYNPDILIVPADVMINHKITTNSHFYKRYKMCPKKDIHTEILALDKETIGRLETIIGEGTNESH